MEGEFNLGLSTEDNSAGNLHDDLSKARLDTECSSLKQSTKANEEDVKKQENLDKYGRMCMRPDILCKTIMRSMRRYFQEKFETGATLENEDSIVETLEKLLNNDQEFKTYPNHEINVYYLYCMVQKYNTKVCDDASVKALKKKVGC